MCLLAGLLSFSLLEALSYLAFHCWESQYKGKVLDIFHEKHFSEVTEEDRRRFLAVRHDSLLGWDYPPHDEFQGTSSNGKKWRATYDASGARDDGLPSKPLGIHTYGDSFTNCDEVDNEETWQYFLEKALSQEVKNFGVSSYGSYQALLKFERHVAQGRVAPVTILGIYATNIDRIGNLYRPYLTPGLNMRLCFKPALTVADDGQVIELPNPFSDSTLSLNELKDRAYEAHKLDFWGNRMARLEFPYSFAMGRRVARYQREGRWLNSWKQPRLLRSMEFVIDRFLATAKRAGTTPVLLFIPGWWALRSESPEGYTPMLKRLRARRIPGLILVDLEEAPFEREKFHVTPFFGHASAYGNQVIAEMLAHHLKGIQETPN